MIDKNGEVHLEDVCKETQGNYVLRLYIAGTTPKSLEAVASVKQICLECMKDCCELEVIDIYQQPVLESTDRIIAVPTLIKRLPLPVRKVIGDIASAEKVIVGLDLRQKRHYNTKQE